MSEKILNRLFYLIVRLRPTINVRYEKFNLSNVQYHVAKVDPKTTSPIPVMKHMHQKNSSMLNAFKKMKTSNYLHRSFKMSLNKPKRVEYIPVFEFHFEHNGRFHMLDWVESRFRRNIDQKYLDHKHRQSEKEVFHKF